MGACVDHFKLFFLNGFIYLLICLILCHPQGLIINNKTVPWGQALLLLSGLELLCAGWFVHLMGQVTSSEAETGGGDRMLKNSKII